ncbi:hypothetical protein LCGC14_3031470, partial [marine sediment metagenome]
VFHPGDGSSLMPTIWDLQVETAAVISKHFGWSQWRNIAHQDHTRRKVDQRFAQGAPYTIRQHQADIRLAMEEPPPPPPPVAPPPTPIAAPPAVQALLTFNPCLEPNVLAVCAAQRALGVTVDGKYGSGTATAARSLLPNAPAGCSPRPAWWAPPNVSNCVARPPLKRLPPPPPVPVEPPPDEPPPAPPTDEIEPITPPEEKKGLSTGAIIAGGLGAAALVGITAIAITQKKKKPTTKRRRPTKRKKKTRKKKKRR